MAPTALDRPVLRTARTRLRPVAPADAPAMVALANDLDIARMTTSIPHPFVLPDAEGFIARMERRDAAREVAFAIHDRKGRFAGVMGLHPTAAGTEIGYWLGRPFWGRGLATEAALAVLAFAVEAWDRRFIVSGHFDDNLASGRVLTKVGFLYTGEIQPRWSVARGGPARTRMMVWLAA